MHSDSRPPWLEPRLFDLAEDADKEIGIYQLSFILPTPKLVALASQLPPLTWHSVRYHPDTASQVPDDKRGTYAFVIATHGDSLPQHGYVCYIGIAGRDSTRSLRARYKDYFTPSKIEKRMHVTRMLTKWWELLYFFYAPVPDSTATEELQRIERLLNSAFLPPFARGDLDAVVAAQRKAFQA